MDTHHARKGYIKTEAETIGRCYSPGSEGGRRGPEPKNAALEAGKAGNRFSPRASRGAEPH